MSDIYKIAEETQNQWNQYSPKSFHTWSKPFFEEFDNSECGTSGQLRDRRERLEKDLRDRYKDYTLLLIVKQGACERAFADELAAEFFLDAFAKRKVNKCITDTVYYHAYERGHSSGCREVVTEYKELADFVMFIIRESEKCREE